MKKWEKANKKTPVKGKTGNTTGDEQINHRKARKNEERDMRIDCESSRTDRPFERGN